MECSYSSIHMAGYSYLAHVVLQYTLLGRNLYAVGVNRKTAYYLGIDIIRVQLAAYAISGFLAATAGILVAGWQWRRPKSCRKYVVTHYCFSSFGWHKLGRRKRDGTGYDHGVLIMTLITNILN